MKNLLTTGTLVVSSVLALAGCQSISGQMKTGNPVAQPIMKSKLMTVNEQPQQIGQLFLRPVDDGVQIYGQVMNLQPGASMGFHIHETGSCGNMGKQAGEHFNPTNMPHGEPNSMQSHVGDLPNLVANQQGVATINFVDKKISSNLIGPNSVYRRAFILHANQDDYTTQPSGGSGDRVACGIIEKS